MTKEKKENGGSKNADTPLYVVGIGASAGGLEALEALFETMPIQTGLAFVIVQHLSPDYKSLMDELLGRKTRIPISVVKDDMEVKADHIYLIPNNQEMIISNGHFFLSERERNNTAIYPINTFLRSLADDFQHRSIAVILSGSGADGSKGAIAVHDAGGFVVAQQPDTCSFGDMPKNAIATRCVHLVLSLEKIAESIMRYSRTTEDVARHLELGLPDNDEKRFTEIILLLRNRFDLDFSQYKPSTITRRIDRRLVAKKLSNLNDYLDVLLSDEDEVQALYFDLLIGVTSFFRDKKHFTSLQRCLPQLVQDFNDEKEIRVWVAGCATGQEAYSFAIMLCEYFEEHQIFKKWKIFATDIHQTSIVKAASGCFHERELEGLSPELIAKYFTQVDEFHYQVNPNIRKTIVFSRHDVIKDPPFTKTHLVSCRNLLIYLNQATQNRVLSVLAFSLRQNGLLFLGPSESIQKHESTFTAVNQTAKLYQKTGERVQRAGLDSNFLERSTAISNNRIRGLSEAPSISIKGKKAIEALLQQYVPPSILLDTGGNILRIFGSAKDFLSINAGVPTLNIQSMINYPAKAIILQMLAKVKRNAKPTVFKRIEGIPGWDLVDVEVKPLSSCSEDMDYLLLSFNVAKQEQITETIELLSSNDTDIHLPNRLCELEEELHYTKESLQSTVEELETSNEELQATNEELMASNEELQSTNEELQSVNEELYTINAEYQAKERERSELETDQKNILDIIGTGVLILDAQLKVKKYSPLTAKIFNLLEGDEGRPVQALNIPERSRVLELINLASQKGCRFEEELQLPEGATYVTRIHPYQPSGERVEQNKGIVLSFTDISARKSLEDSLRSSDQRYQAVLDALSDGFFEWDLAKGNIFVSPSLLHKQGLEIGEDLRWEHLLGDSAQKFVSIIEHSTEPFVFPIKFQDTAQKERWVLCKGERKDQTITGIFIDIQVLKEKEFELERSKSELLRSNKLLEEFAYIVSHDLKAPLRHILYYLDYLKDALSTENLEQAKKELQIIFNCAGRLGTMVDDIITWSRLSSERKKMEKVDLDEVLESTLITLAPVLKEKNILIDRLPLPQVTGDRASLEHLIQNLIANACKYNSKSECSIKIRCIETDSDHILSIEDNGDGIPSDQKDRVFLPFKRLVSNDSIEGTGIGLAICKTIVEQHQGTLSLDSELGKGSTFNVSLPKVEENAGV